MVARRGVGTDDPTVTVRLTPEAFAKPPGGVRRAAVELLSALRRSSGGLAVSVSPRVDGTTLSTPTPSMLERGMMQIAESAYFAKRRLSGKAGVAHSLYYDQQHRPADWPLVVTVHDMIHERFGSGSTALRWAKKLSVENASLIITPSRATASDLAGFFPRLRADVTTIPWGVGNVFLQGRREPTRDDRSPFLLYVGARWKYKNFGALDRALATAPDLNEFGLMLVGGEPLADEERMRLIDTLGTPDRLAHVARASDDLLRQLYDEAAALVVTSRCEGFGLPLLEAMARGCPVACAAGGSSEEVAGGFALTFDPDSPEGCADAIRNAVSSPNDIRRSAQAHACSHDWSRTADAHVAAYRALAC
jgi:glycosyltransferase involved in cell wall biosynthesis